MDRTELRMQELGSNAGSNAALYDEPWATAETLATIAEAQRRRVCAACASDDACADWGNHRACPAGLRRTFRRAYRIAYRETMRARIAAMDKPTTSETDTEGREMDTVKTPKHTPGPWRAWDPEGRGGDAIPIIDSHGAMFAAVEAIDITDEQAHEQQQANAQLIVAAPDLLAACNAALAYLDAEDSAGLVAEIAAAVAKAEGRMELDD